MKYRGSLAGATVTVTALLSLIVPSASAATFNHTVADQDKFVAVAVPRAGGYYNLLVLEQLSSEKDCWKEVGRRPTQIEPLLLNFDFTGICGRGTDSNGYSIRIAEEDLGMNYSLSIRRQEKNLVLLGVPRSRSVGDTMEIATTKGMGDGFLKLELNSGWRFAKRVYSGKTLGHIYLYREKTPPAYKGSFASTQQVYEPVASASSLPPLSSPRAIPVPSTPATPSGDRNYRLMVLAPSSWTQSQVRTIVPDAFRSSYQGQSVMQVGRFNRLDKAKELERELKGKGFKVVMATETQSIPAAPKLAYAGSTPAGVLAVPSSAPLGNASGVSDVYTGSGLGGGALPPPPPPTQVAIAPRYRIFVSAPSSQQQSKVRSLVPGAFRSYYQGQQVMQVGSFAQPSEADAVMALMKRNGFSPMMEKSL